MPAYDAVLVVSFGGPEGPDDVMPFLENVLRGKNVPRERMLEVAEHYQHFGGVSPINEQNRQLIAALEQELAAHGPQLPIYWGNRNWHPLLPDTLRQMAADGVQRALAFFTSAFSSYSGCRQYRENIAAAQRRSRPRGAAGRQAAGVLQSSRLHRADGRVARELPRADSGRAARRGQGAVHGPQHSAVDGRQLPLRSSTRRGLPTGGRGAGVAPDQWELVYQSRSGPPHQPWLEPDVCDRIEELHKGGNLRELVIVPIGFISDHMEVLVRPRYRSPRALRTAGRPHAAGGDGGRPSSVHPDDSGTHCRTNRRRPRSARFGVAWRQS